MRTSCCGLSLPSPPVLHSSHILQFFLRTDCKSKGNRGWSKATQETVLHMSYAKHLTAIRDLVTHAFCILVSSPGVEDMQQAKQSMPSFLLSWILKTDNRQVHQRHGDDFSVEAQILFKAFQSRRMRRCSLGETLIQNHSSHLAPLRLRPRLIGGLWNEGGGTFSLGSDLFAWGESLSPTSISFLHCLS